MKRFSAIALLVAGLVTASTALFARATPEAKASSNCPCVVCACPDCDGVHCSCTTCACTACGCVK